MATPKREFLSFETMYGWHLLDELWRYPAEIPTVALQSSGICVLDAPEVLYDVWPHSFCPRWRPNHFSYVDQKIPITWGYRHPCSFVWKIYFLSGGRASSMSNRQVHRGWILFRQTIQFGSIPDSMSYVACVIVAISPFILTITEFQLIH